MAMSPEELLDALFNSLSGGVEVEADVTANQFVDTAKAFASGDLNVNLTDDLQAYIKGHGSVGKGEAKSGQQFNWGQGGVDAFGAKLHTALGDLSLEHNPEVRRPNRTKSGHETWLRYNSKF